MPSAHALRLQIEHALERRFPAALSPAPRAALLTASTGIPAVDELLSGGLPIGAISEITGPECSGRTTLALSFLALSTCGGNVCAWIDAGDSFDPESAAATGVNLRQLLWVRCRNQAPGKAHQPTARPWTCLDQAIRTADLILQAGGFSAIVLDLGGAAPEYAKRIPLATWFRFRQAAQRTQCSLIVLGQASCAQSSADTVLECSVASAKTQAQTVLSGFVYEVRRERGVSAKAARATSGMRKPPLSTWSASAAWNSQPDIDEDRRSA